MTTEIDTNEPVLLVEQHDAVRLLTLNRPSVRNALNTDLIHRLRTAIADADADDRVDVVVLTGSGDAFCAGLDLRQLGGTGANAEHISADTIPVGHPWTPIRKPVIGAVNGPAITGGLEIALACDFLIASDRARFADTHSRVGVLPGWGLTTRLPEAVGAGFARRMSMTGDFVDAAGALRVGLVTEVVPHDELVPTTLRVAFAVAQNDQQGLRTLLASYRRAHAHIIDPALAAENATSVAWMRGFDPATVAERRASIVERGRDQNKDVQ
ncbi:enoyl-CoA hydratase [Gordonia liuliyuniae]|uniref:Enoyl-CoA hydratase n=1 Tax=Gordonia liuliyuniae TaxID=2911517 RepID=A0ABS9IP42_9ACTN|nr:enoyl-CoA hydratase [Gordonia liuliyuniae]MCF8587299.1 enoyl-CoA hydratase [Gordonia liuliyuniae]